MNGKPMAIKPMKPIIKSFIKSLKYELFLISGRLITVHYSDEIKTYNQCHSAAIRKARRNQYD